MHLSPTVAWTVVPDVGLYNVTERPQYGFPFDWVPMNAKGRAIAMSLPVLTVQPHAPRPPSQWVTSPSQAAPCPSQLALLEAEMSLAWTLTEDAEAAGEAAAEADDEATGAADEDQAAAAGE